MNLREKSPILLCIDLQIGFLDEAAWGGGRNNPAAEEISGKLLGTWRALGLPVIHVCHSSNDPYSQLHKNNPGFPFNPLAAPIKGEPIVTKSVNSAFIGTNLQELIDANGTTTLVIVGLTTDHCVSTTTRMAGNYGYETILISDATATFDRVGIDGTRLPSELVHHYALASLHNEFATVMTARHLIDIL